MDFSLLHLPIADVLAAALIVVAGYAAIWAIDKVIWFFSYDGEEYFEWTDEDERDFQRHQAYQNSRSNWE